MQWQNAAGLKHVAEFSRLEVTSAEVIQRVVAEHPVRDLHTSEPDIEEVVRQIYRDSEVLVAAPTPTRLVADGDGDVEPETAAETADADNVATGPAAGDGDAADREASGG